MGKLLLAILGFFAVLLLASVITAAAGDGLFAPRFDPVDYARQEAEIARYQAELERTRQLEPLDLMLAAAWRVLPLAAAIGGLAYLGAWGVAHQIRFRRERWPRHDGLLPVELAELPQVGAAALGAYHTARIAEAQRQPVPHALTFSPHYTAHHRADALGPPLAPVAELPAPGGVPTFAALLDGGRVGRGSDGRAQPLLLGVDAETGAELVGDWRDLYSTVVAGFSGSGKTTTQRFLAAQTALHGARFVVVDPHADAGPDSLAATLAPLASCYLCEPASDDRRILEAVRLVADIGDRRVRGRDPDLTPVILWADELTKLLGRSAIGDKLAELLEAVAQEYRKRNVFVCGSGQIWTAERVTSELRDSFASVIAHRMKRGQARMLLPTDEAAQVERLETGRAILWRTSGETTTIAIPNTTRADVARVANLLTDTAPTMPRVSVMPTATNQPGVSHSSALDYSAAASAGAPSAEAARIVALFLEGQDAGAIVTTLTGMTSKAGKPYLAKLAEVQAAIRDQLRKG